MRNGVDEPKGGWGPEGQVEIIALLALVKKKKKVTILHHTSRTENFA